LTPRHFHSLGLVDANTLVGDLGVEASVESEVTHPRHPPLGLDEVTDIALHDDGSRECLESIFSKLCYSLMNMN
jgi:hypothetical protein